MGRLSSLMSVVGASWLALAGCEGQARKPTFTTRDRSQAVAMASSAATASPIPAPVPSAPRIAPRRAGALCGGRLESGAAAPNKPLSRASAPGAAELPERLPISRTGFTWINFWAAWCAPCKEEIPRLRSWEQEFSGRNAKLSVVFVSLDDDERQLRAFLSSSKHLTATYWLKEGEERDAWLASAGLEADPELPVHLLVDSRGKIRCKVQGAVEDEDLSELARLLGGERG